MKVICIVGILLAAMMAMATAMAEEPKPPASQPSSRPTTNPAKVYSEWPFDAKEAARRQGETAKARGVPKELTLDLGNKVTMKLVLIPAGKFMMGSPEGEKDRRKDEGPLREVTITKPLYMGVYEVTQEQWFAIMGTEPWKGNEFAQNSLMNAASYINWNDATEFCGKLSRITGRAVSLPTEAQWEYACRAGTKTRFSYGDDDDYSKLGDYAWYLKNAWDIGEKYPHAVVQKKPNIWGLYDMHGNVWEWCADWYADSYVNAGKVDPTGPASGTCRVLRGGSFNFNGWACRCAMRIGNDPTTNPPLIHGFRVVVTAGDEAEKPPVMPTSMPASRPTSRPTTNPAKVYTEWPFDDKEAVRRQEETAKALGVPKELTLDLGNKVTMKLVLIPAGKFMMGSPKDENGRVQDWTFEMDGYVDKEPRHEVTISKPFYIGVYDVTQEQYEAVTGKNPSWFKGALNPVEEVTWEQSVEFCRKLATRTGRAVQLPTEAQWEYACRAGTQTPFNTGKTISTDQANIDGADLFGDGLVQSNGPAAREKTTPVGSFKPNAWGLYDMHGNVWQWCSDWDGDISPETAIDPTGPASGEYHVFRGSTYQSFAYSCRSAYRSGVPAGGRYTGGGGYIGFRVAVGVN